MIYFHFESNKRKENSLPGKDFLFLKTYKNRGFSASNPKIGSKLSKLMPGHPN